MKIQHSVKNVTSACIFANMPQYVNEPHKRYLENKIRENWDFQGANRYLY
jgi:GTP-binding protein